jgi:hypothetical protein
VQTVNLCVFDPIVSDFIAIDKVRYLYISKINICDIIMPSNRLKGREGREPEERPRVIYIEGSQFAMYRFKERDGPGSEYRPIENLTLTKLLGRPSAEGKSLERAAVFDRKSDTLVGFVKQVELETESGILRLEVEVTNSNEKVLRDAERK